MNIAIGIALVLIFFCLFFLLCVALMSYSTLLRISEYLSDIHEEMKGAHRSREKAPRDTGREVAEALNKRSAERSRS